MTIRRTKTKRTRPRRDRGPGGMSPPNRSRTTNENYQWNQSDIKRLQEIHAARTWQAQITDEALVAPIAPTPDHWIRYPDRYDIQGIDYPEHKTPQEQTTTPTKASRKTSHTQNPMQTPDTAKKYLANIVEKYSAKLGIDEEIRLSATKRGHPARIRYYRDGKTPKIEVNYDHFAQIYEVDPNLTKRYLEYAIAHELSHAQQYQELGWKGYLKAHKEANIELELDADKRAHLALGRSEEMLIKDLKELAEKTGGEYSNKYRYQKVKEGSDLNRFREKTPTNSSATKMRVLYSKTLGGVVPTATQEEMTRITKKAIAEQWIKPKDNAEAAMKRVTEKAQAELIQIRQAKAHLDREAQLKALKDRADKIHAGKTDEQKHKERLASLREEYGVQYETYLGAAISQLATGKREQLYKDLLAKGYSKVEAAKISSTFTEDSIKNISEALPLARKAHMGLADDSYGEVPELWDEALKKNSAAEIAQGHAAAAVSDAYQKAILRIRDRTQSQPLQNPVKTCKESYEFYADPGHGWLKVPLSKLDELGLADSISPYSFMRKGYAYLEEDSDAGKFIEALKKKGVEVTIDEHTANYESSIRLYDGYETPLFLKAKKAILESQTSEELNEFLGVLNRIPLSERDKKRVLEYARAKTGQLPEKPKLDTVRGKIARMSINEANALIRDHIKAACPTVSIRKGTGTARGWLDVSGSKDEYGNFTDQEKKQLEALGISASGNVHPMDFDEKAHFIERHQLLDEKHEAKPKPEPMIEIPDKKAAPPMTTGDETRRVDAVIKQIQSQKPHLTEAAVRDLIKQENAKTAGLLTEEAAAHLVAASLDIPLNPTNERQGGVAKPEKAHARRNPDQAGGVYRVDSWSPETRRWSTRSFNTPDQAEQYTRLINDNPGWPVESFKERLGHRQGAPKYMILAENTQERGSEAIRYEVYDRDKSDRNGQNLVARGVREYKQVPGKEQLVKDLTEEYLAKGPSAEVDFKLVPHWTPSLSMVEHIAPARPEVSGDGKWMIAWTGRNRSLKEGVGMKTFDTYEDALDFVRDRAEGERVIRGRYNQGNVEREAIWEPIQDPPMLPEELRKGFTGKQERFEVDPKPSYEGLWNSDTKKMEYKWVFRNKTDHNSYTVDELQAEHQKGEWRRRDREEAAKHSSSITREKGAKRAAFDRRAMPIVGAISHPESAIIEAKGDTVSFEGMDPSHVSLLKIRVPNELRIPDGKYEKAEESLDKRVTVYRRPEKLTWDNVERSMVIMNGDQKSSIRYEKVHEYENRFSEPRVNFTTKTKLNMIGLNKAAEDLLRRGTNHIILKVKDGDFIYESEKNTPQTVTHGEGAEAWESEESVKTQVTGKAGTVVNTDVTEVRATYSTDRLSENLDRLIKAGFREAKLEFVEDMPLRITAKRNDGAEAEFWLAPMIGV